MLLETAIRSEVGADLVALLVHRDASKRQRIRVSKARAIIVTGDPYHFSRQKTFASLKLQECGGEPLFKIKQFVDRHLLTISIRA